MTDNIAEFVCRKPDIHRDGKVMKPEFGFPVALTDMHVRRFVAFIRIEKSPIGTPAQSGSHVPSHGNRAQYLWLIGSSSAGNSVITRQPLSVTTTSSSMRAAENPSLAGQ